MIVGFALRKMNLSMSHVYCLTRTFNIQRDANGHLYWAKKRDFIIPSEEELKRMVLPENVSFLFHFQFSSIPIFYDSSMAMSFDSHGLVWFEFSVNQIFVLAERLYYCKDVVICKLVFEIACHFICNSIVWLVLLHENSCILNVIEIAFNLHC